MDQPAVSSVRLATRLGNLYHWLTPRRYYWLLAGLSALHILYSAVYKTHSGVDGEIYQRIARAINASPDFWACGAFEGAFSPLFSIYLAGFWQLLGTAPWVFFLGNILMALGITLAARVYLTGLFDDLVGRWSSLLFYASMMVFYFTLYYRYELLSTLLLSLALLLLIRSRQLLVAILVAGVCFGLAVLATARILSLMPGLVLILWTYRKEVSLARSLALIGLFTVATGAAIAPWTVRNYICLDKFIPLTPNGGIVFYMGFNEKSDAGYLNQHNFPPPYDTLSPSHDLVFYRGAWDFILAHPARVLQLAAKKAYVTWRIHYFDSSFFYPFFWIGIFILPRLVTREKRGLAIAVQVMFIGYTLFHCLFSARHYYLIPVLPVIYGIAVACQHRLGQYWLKRSRPA